MEPDTGTRTRRSKMLKRLLFGVVATIGLAAAAGGGYWAWTCPCDGIPGFALRGDRAEQQVSDWSFANDVPLCQIQISVGWRPHSVNLNCMATPEGELFLSCSVGAQKYWCPKVGPDQAGRLRLDGVVYPVVLNRVTAPAVMDRAWAARLSKLQKPEVQAVQPGSGAAPPLDAPRPDHWWTFQVRSAAAG